VRSARGRCWLEIGSLLGEGIFVLEGRAGPLVQTLRPTHLQLLDTVAEPHESHQQPQERCRSLTHLDDEADGAPNEGSDLLLLRNDIKDGCMVAKRFQRRAKLTGLLGFPE
jgi:hypothetical protein